MGLSDILYRPGEQEISDAVELLRSALAEEELKFPYSLASKLWLIPQEFLPENAKHIHPRTAKLALNQMKEKGEIGGYRHIKYTAYYKEKAIDELIYALRPNAHETQVFRRSSGLEELCARIGELKSIGPSIMKIFTKPTEEEIKEAEYALLDAIDHKGLYIQPRHVWNRNSWLPIDAFYLDTRAAKIALDNLFQKGHISYTVDNKQQYYSSTEAGRTYLELESTKRIAISELEQKFIQRRNSA